MPSLIGLGVLLAGLIALHYALTGDLLPLAHVQPVQASTGGLLAEYGNAGSQK